MKTEIGNNSFKYFQKKLLIWFTKDGRRFPWRKSNLSNYQKVISEVLLQRTKAEIIAKFYPQFIKDYPSWKSLANAKREDIEAYLKPIGLYKQRSTRLLNLANEMSRRNGRFPKNRKELESIPFVGQYIANAIMLLIHNDPQPLLDVNMARLLERFFGPRKLADIRDDPHLQELSRRVVNHKSARKINWAILDFAAAVCKTKVPMCNECCVKKKCKFFANLSKGQLKTF